MKIDCNSPYQQNMKKKPIVISIDTEKLFVSTIPFLPFPEFLTSTVSKKQN